MGGGTQSRRIVHAWGVIAMAVVLAGCTSASAVRAAPTATPGASPSPNASLSPTPSASESTLTPSATPSVVDPGFVPALAAIQMVGPRVGWAVGAHAIFATTDGTRWTKQYASTEEFVGVDFISATTGWAVATRTLLGTTDGGRSWHQLGEPRVPIRSIHFATATQGWGIAGGSDPQQMHGWLVPHDGATLVYTYDGGVTWSPLDGPPNPQTVCFSDPGQGWIGTPEGVYIYRNTELGHDWSKVMQRPDQQPTLPQATLIQCAAPRALWVLFLGGQSAMSHSPYIAYATVDGSTWKSVMKESVSEGQILPGVPAGPDTYPPSFSVVDPQDAVFVGDGPATNVAQCVVASNGGATLRRTGRIVNAPETFAAAFVSVTTGWVLTRNAGGDYVIDATADGGYHWSQQLAVPPTSAG